MNIWFRSQPNQEWQWCADVVDRKAHEYADRKNKRHDGSWYVAENQPARGATV